MKVIIGNNKSKFFETYRQIANIWWNDGKFERELGEHFDDLEIAYIIFGEECIGGFVLSKKIINKFFERENLEILEKLKNKNYYNLSYLIIDEKYRGRLIGRELLMNFFENTNKFIWLSSKEQRKDFYLSLGLKQINNKLGEDNYIFINK